MNAVMQNGAGGPSVEVSITATNEKSAAELAAEREKKSAQAEQNALPVWHTNSTVSGDLTRIGTKEAAARAARDFDGFKPGAIEEKKAADDTAGVQQAGKPNYPTPIFSPLAKR